MVREVMWGQIGGEERRRSVMILGVGAMRTE